MVRNELKKTIDTLSDEIIRAGMSLDASGISNKDLIKWSIQLLLRESINELRIELMKKRLYG